MNPCSVIGAVPCEFPRISGNRLRGGVGLKAKKYRILAERCKNCGICIEKCPGGAIVRNDGDVCQILEDHCSYCGICKEVCQVQAVKEIFSIRLLWRYLNAV